LESKPVSALPLGILTARPSTAAGCPLPSQDLKEKLTQWKHLAFPVKGHIFFPKSINVQKIDFHI
jgi:hypothetical protein